MDLYNLVISAKLSKGEGGDVSVDPLSVTENGVYTASSGHAYSPVTVSVPQSGITPTGTKDISANGVYDVTDFASASVSVPTGVFPSGTSSITSNGIYDITNFASVDVNVSGGGGFTADDIAMKTASGAMSGSATSLFACAFSGYNGITAANFPNAIGVGFNCFFYCINLEEINMPNVATISNSAFQYCSKLKSAYFENLTSIGSYVFYSCVNLESVYLLASSVLPLGFSNTFSYTPIAKSSYLGRFGSIYVPASLVSDYKAASTWSYFADRITAYEG